MNKKSDSQKTHRTAKRQHTRQSLVTAVPVSNNKHKKHPSSALARLRRASSASSASLRCIFAVQNLLVYNKKTKIPIQSAPRLCVESSLFKIQTHSTTQSGNRTQSKKQNTKTRIDQSTQINPPVTFLSAKIRPSAFYSSLRQPTPRPKNQSQNIKK
jgi:hypothetical protein